MKTRKYRLIKEYPGSPGLYSIACRELTESYYKINIKEEIKNHLSDYKRVMSCHDIEHSPEFWELIVKKDYEVLTMLGSKKEGSNLYRVNADGTVNPWTNPMKSVEEALSYNYTIHSVKRLSDEEVFTVGDKIDNNGIIKNFYIGTESSQKHMMFYNCCYSISLLNKVEKPLFTTEDGVDIFKEMNVGHLIKIVLMA